MKDSVIIIVIIALPAIILTFGVASLVTHEIIESIKERRQKNDKKTHH